MFRALIILVSAQAAGEGPSLIEAKVYRYRPHTNNDDDTLYRPPEEVEAWMKRDPIVLFERLLERAGLLSPAYKAELRDRATKEAEEAGRQALDSLMSSNSVSRVQLRQHGVDKFFPKPIDMGLFVEAVKELLHRRDWRAIDRGGQAEATGCPSGGLPALSGVGPA